MTRAVQLGRTYPAWLAKERKMAWDWPGHHNSEEGSELKYLVKAMTWLTHEIRDLLPRIERIEQGQTKMDATIQQAIDDVADLKSVVQSNNAAFKVLTDMNATQAATIADLEAKIAAGSGVTAADLDALKASNVDFAQALVDLKANVPANTGAK